MHINHHPDLASSQNEKYIPPARFVMKAKKDAIQSIEKGRPIFKDCAYIEILKERGCILCFEASDMYKERYPREWEKFEAQQEKSLTGTPLEQWCGCTRSECETLKYAGIMSVEQLAECSDDVLGSGGLDLSSLRSNAATYLEEAQNKGSISRKYDQMREGYSEKVQEIEDLKATIHKLEGQIKRLKKSGQKN